MKIEEKNKKNDEVIYFNTGSGDCSIVSIYLDGKDNETREINILFDMGYKNDKIIEAIEKEKIFIHGIVVTHVDQDHIIGIIKLLESKNSILDKLSFIVFNSFDSSLISYRHGDELENVLKKDHYRQVKLINSYGEHEEILDKDISFFTVENRKLLGNLKLKNKKIIMTFISPKIEDLKKLNTEWKIDREYRKGRENSKGATGPITNNSSIVCLIETGNSNILMTGDQKLKNFRDDLIDLKNNSIIDKIDCMKLSHHGTRGYNDGYEELIKEFSIKNIFSTPLKSVTEECFINEVKTHIKNINNEYKFHDKSFDENTLELTKFKVNGESNEESSKN